MLKLCTGCGMVKEYNISNFEVRNKQTGKLRSQCRICVLRRRKEYRNKNREIIKRKNKKNYKKNRCKILQYQKKYLENNKEKIATRSKLYRETHKEEIKVRNKRYRTNNKNKNKEYQKSYREKNKDKIRKNKRNYIKNRRKTDLLFYIQDKIFNLIRAYLRRRNPNGISTTLNKLGYSKKDFFDHFESLFESWMNWNNWGVYNPNTWDDNDPSTWTWQIDHIIPQSCFIYSSMDDDEFKKCWALSNLRPLKAKTNILDNNRKKKK